jgi:hypothetical protein
MPAGMTARGGGAGGRVRLPQTSAAEIENQSNRRSGGRPRPQTERLRPGASLHGEVEPDSGCVPDTRFQALGGSFSLAPLQPPAR